MALLCVSVCGIAQKTSPSVTAIRMIKEVYGHINLTTRQRAMEQLERFMESQQSRPPSGSAQLEEFKNATLQ
jgi:hypothetical protein